MAMDDMIGRCGRTFPPWKRGREQGRKTPPRGRTLRSDGMLRSFRGGDDMTIVRGIIPILHGVEASPSCDDEARMRATALNDDGAKTRSNIKPK